MNNDDDEVERERVAAVLVITAIKHGWCHPKYPLISNEDDDDYDDDNDDV